MSRQTEVYVEQLQKQMRQVQEDIAALKSVLEGVNNAAMEGDEIRPVANGKLKKTKDVR